MKKTYFSPEIDVVKFSLSDLILGDSVDESPGEDMGGGFDDLPDDFIIPE